MFFIWQNFFGFGPSAEVDIVLDGQEGRKTAEIKTEEGRKERHLLYYDGESVSGKASEWICYLYELRSIKLACHINVILVFTKYLMFSKIILTYNTNACIG
jgi:hypothetical protein